MLYDALAPVYDAWQAADGTPFALLAYAKLEPRLARQSAGTRSFLDLGCGTGELLLALGRAHPSWRLAGVDASGAMLAVAATKPGATRVAWIRALLGAPLPFGATFDAAGAFYDTLNHLPDAAALGGACAAVARTLRPGGLFAFDMTNRLGFERWWTGRRRWSGPGWSVTVEMTQDTAAHSGDALVSVEHGGAARSFELRERWFPDAEVAAALAGAGLDVEKSEPWSPFSFDAPGKTWWIARKKP